MLASPLPEWFTPSVVPGCWWRENSWVAEEKYDGHRVCIGCAENGRDLFGNPVVRTWSRNAIENVLPRHLQETMSRFPSGVYDGEILMPGQRSYGTQRVDNSSKLVLIIFDVVDLLGHDTTGRTYRERRQLLEEMFARLNPNAEEGVQLAWSRPINTIEELQAETLAVWQRDGEGLILKNVDHFYQPGKRVKHWLKVKQLRTSVLTVVGYRGGQMGPHSVLVLRDDDGNTTTVKWRTLADLKLLDENPGSFIGRRLRIEFQERTPDGGYRHPRWDRWEKQ